MTIKPFAIQGADLNLGGVNLSAGSNGVVIPGVTQAVNYRVEEVNERGNSNNQDLGSDAGVITVIDNSRWLAITTGDNTPSADYVAATYSVDELDDGNIEEINVETEGVFLAADKARAEAGNMWATLQPTPFTGFNSANWIQIPFRPKMRAGAVENVGGSGNLEDIVATSEEGFTKLTLANKDFTIETTRTDYQDADINLTAADDIFITALNDDIVLFANDEVRINTDDENYEWIFDNNGNLTLPQGGDILDSTGASVLGGGAGDNNIWVQTFETVDGAPTDIVGIAVSVEYDGAGNVISLFSHYSDIDGNTYYSVGKYTTTGTKLWTARFADGFDTDGWGLAVDNDSNSIYVAGESEADGDGQFNATLTKLDATDGSIIWSKTYDFGFNSESSVVDVASDGNPVMVGFANNSTDAYVATTKVDAADGSIIWSRSLDGQGYEEAYGMAVGPTGEVVAIGYMEQLDTVVASYPVTPSVGSGANILVINRSDLSNDTFTDSWQVAGTGITGTIGVNAINIYEGLTSTVREGSGAVFEIADNGDSTYGISGMLNNGTNYLAGHKILVLGTDLGGATPANDCVVTVDSISEGGLIFQWSVAGVAAGSVFNIYTPLTGTNYQTGSGLTFDFFGDSGSTYTEHNYAFQNFGTNYVTGDVVTISGALLGGTSPANDLIATVGTLNGIVTSFGSFTGTQQTTTYRVRTDDAGIDFGGVGTWTLNDVSTDFDDRMLVVKYNSAGVIQWQKAILFDVGFDCRGADADIDSAGNIYVTGSYQYSFEGGTTSALSILKLDSTGAKQWSRRVTGDCDTFGVSVVVGADDKLYLSGMTGNNNDENNTFTWVAAKYGIDGTVEWQRLIDNTTSWTFTGGLFFSNGGGSNIAVKQDYVVLSGGFGDFNNNTVPQATLVQVAAAGDVFSVGDWDFKAALFSGLLNGTASDITVVDAGKTDTDNAESITTSPVTLATEVSNFLLGTLYTAGSSDERLVNGANELVLEPNGAVTLPQGGTISEGVVTSNPTIQLTPASPTVASQKLVIKGGANYVFNDNGIELSYSNNTALVGDTLTFSVYSTAYFTNQTLYWWIYPAGAGIGDSESGTFDLENSSGSFSILIDSDDYEFTVRVSPENNNYDPLTLGVESGLINADAPAFDGDHHLHLTTGDLAVTSIILGTDNHNVRTTVDGGISMTTTRGTVLFGNVPEVGPTESSHFHVMKDTGADIDLFFGDDYNYVKLPTTQGVEVSANGSLWTFGTDGDITLPAGGDVVDSTSVSQLAKRVEGSWTLPDDSTDTYSFTVPSDGTYIMWVKGNIPNGIITWNATVSVSNFNVPAIGTQYAWNYTGGGTPIELINLPNQIRGTAGTISTDATYAGTTSNRFDFDISNTSGAAVTVYYGYTKI